MTKRRREHLTEAEFERRYRQGGRRIAPGIWEDRDGGIHFSVPELLAMVDLSDTPENRRQVEQTIAETDGGERARRRDHPRRTHGAALSAEEFTCASCGLVFDKGDDDRANAEARELWNVEHASGSPYMAIVCDDCWQRFMAWFTTTGGTPQ